MQPSHLPKSGLHKHIKHQTGRIPKWVWWSIAGVVVLIIGASTWYVVSIGNAVKNVTDTGSMTQETASQTSTDTTSAKDKGGFEYKGVKYHAVVSSISLVGDDLKTADSMRIKGSLEIESRPEGLTGNVPNFDVALVVPKSLLKEGESGEYYKPVCGPMRTDTGNIHRNEFDPIYYPLKSNPEYCVNQAQNKNINPTFGYGAEDFTIGGRYFKPPIDKSQIKIRFKVGFTNEAGGNSDGEEFLVPYNASWDK